MRCPTCYGRLGFRRSLLVWARFRTVRYPGCRERVRRGRLYRRGRAGSSGRSGPIGVLWLSARYARLEAGREG
jgi:hypothetical protein